MEMSKKPNSLLLPLSEELLPTPITPIYSSAPFWSTIRSKIVGAARKDHITYIIHVDIDYGRSQWLVYRRYSEFYAFRKLLFKYCASQQFKHAKQYVPMTESYGYTPKYPLLTPSYSPTDSSTSSASSISSATDYSAGYHDGFCQYLDSLRLVKFPRKHLFSTNNWEKVNRHRLLELNLFIQSLVLILQRSSEESIEHCEHYNCSILNLIKRFLDVPSKDKLGISEEIEEIHYSERRKKHKAPKLWSIVKKHKGRSLFPSLNREIKAETIEEKRRNHSIIQTRTYDEVRYTKTRRSTFPPSVSYGNTSDTYMKRMPLYTILEGQEMIYTCSR